MKRKKGRKILVCLLVMLCVSGIRNPCTKAKTVVEKRLAAVRNDYPAGSRINSYISVNEYNGGGCNALVMYATLKIFHNAYVPGENTFRKIGKTASTKSNKAMRSLFKKAKPGDVIRWRKGYTDSHFAIFLAGNTKGVYIYEANFGSRNKVWYKHFWAWKNMRKWPKGGANKVNVYRSKNYNQVNRGKAATNYKKGDEFVVEGLRYRVTKAGAITGTVKFVRYETEIADTDGKKIPKYLYVNKDISSKVNSNEESHGGSSKKSGKNAQIVYKVKKQ